MSTNLLPNELIQWLPCSETILKVSQLSGGLIHRTYVVRTASESILLQSINTQIFSEPAGLIQNHRALYQHFQAPRSPFALAMPLPFSNDAWIVQDDQGASWRLSQFIAGTHTLHEVESPAQAEALAQFFARFTRHAADPKDPHWAIPIAKFHDLTHRFNQFQTSLSSGIPERILSSQPLIESLIARKAYVEFYNQLRNNLEFPLRMMHHDAKLSNVLIHSSSGQWVCPIDLDTVMPGYFFSDLGDMIRSLCNSQAEDAIASKELQLRKDIYRALVRGYLTGMGDALTTTEKKHIHKAGLIMTYMQALRFLTDHLNGDIYYRVDHPGQNWERASNQFALLMQLESYLNQPDDLG